MILKTINHFSKLNISSLHAHLIFDCRNLVLVGRRNLGGARIRQHPATGILTANQIPTETSRNPAMVRIRQDLAGIQSKWPDSSGCRQLIYLFNYLQ
jgi:hypothetical protein